MASLFSFYGRAGRGKWWLTILGSFVVLLGALLLMPIIDAVPVTEAFGANSSYKPSLQAILMLSTIALSVSIIISAVTVKRFHDRGQSGWCYLPLLIANSGSETLSYTKHTAYETAGVIWFFVSLIVSLGFIVILGFLPGTQGPNQYGADPSQPRRRAAFA